MTQEQLNNHIIDIRCKAGTLAASWSDKVRLGKWCDEQECALILADWALDILCNHIPCEETPVEVEVLSQITGILQAGGFEEGHFLLLPMTVGNTLNLYVNGELVSTYTVQTGLQNYNYNMATLLYNHFGDSLTMFNGLNEYETPQDVPIGELVYYTVTTACNEPINKIYVEELNSLEELESVWYITEPTPYSKDMELLGPVIVEGVCINNHPCFTNCFTEDEICELIHKTKKVLTFKCNCC